MSDVPKGLFCAWVDEGEQWKCARCGAVVPKSVSADTPFAGCSVGMKEAGVEPTALLKASPRRGPEMGPGTELKAMLSWLVITPTPTCSCNQRAIQMDFWGADECERRKEEILGWLKEEAQKRSLPFVEPAARKMVEWAISRARKSQKPPLTQ